MSLHSFKLFFLDHNQKCSVFCCWRQCPVHLISLLLDCFYHHTHPLHYADDQDNSSDTEISFLVDHTVVQTAMLATKQGNGVSMRAITDFFFFFYAAVLLNVELISMLEIHLCGSPSYLLSIFHVMASFRDRQNFM